MTKKSERPTVLSVAGSDSGGGAGIQADLKTLSSLGVHGTSAITCITAQNPNRILGLKACRPEQLRLQLEAVFEGFQVAVVKTGMLFSKGLIEEVSKWINGTRPLIVDPVMVSTSGTPLLQRRAFQTLCRELFPKATLITPNVNEAELLLGQRLRELDDLREASAALNRQYGCAVLVKGGHIKGEREAVDFFRYKGTELLLKAPFIPGKRTHGTGCTYAAAIAGYLALGCDLPYAVELAKKYITHAIAESYRAGGHDVLNHFWEGRGI